MDSLTVTPVAERTNPVHRFAGAALDALDRVAEVPGWGLSAAEQAEVLVELGRVASRVTELRWRMLAAAESGGLADADGSTSAAAWLARRTRETRARCNGALRGAKALADPRFAVTREAFAAGALTEDQVWVIVRAVEDLPAGEVTEEQRAEAQRHLVGLAAEHDAKALRILAARIFEVLAPEEADAREAEALEREERRARERTRFALRDNGDGTTSGWFTLPTAQAQMLSKAVQAFAAPRRTSPEAWVDAEGRRRPFPVLLGQGFADLVEHLPVDRLPQAGGAAATVVVTMDLERLRAGVGSAVLDTGARVSVGQWRRLACNAGVVPAVLGGGSVPLDLGRRRRLHTEAQRMAMAVRDGGCTALGCDRPPAWCEAHHEDAWSEGGGTSVDLGRLLCPHHHHLAHDTRYRTRRHPDNQISFHRRG
jgi:hypothetical protein